MAIRSDIGGAALLGAPTLGIVRSLVHYRAVAIACSADDVQTNGRAADSGTNTVVGLELEVICMGTDSQVRAAAWASAVQMSSGM